MARPETHAAAHDAGTRPSALDPSGTKPGQPAGPHPAAAPHPARVGGYRVVRLLGEGGMGFVYHAHDDRADRPVALKTMRPEVTAQPGAAERFLREARAAARVEHDHIIPIWQVGEDAGVPFIAMPLLRGEPLNILVAAFPLPPLGVTLKVGREVADGLAAAHARGLIHRDVKPANIWLEGDPASTDWANKYRRTRILDFGLARPTDDHTQLTGTGAVLGTPAYMSPEQARGEPVDARTDLFSLGVVLYRMAAGRPPFAGVTAMAVLTSLAVDTPRPPAELNPKVPPALSALIMRLLEKDPARRPASAAAVGAAVREIGRQWLAERKSGPLPAVVARPVAEESPWSGIDDPTEAEPAAPSAAPAPARRPRGIGVWVAAAVAGVVAAVLAGVVVVKVIGPDGKETTVEVPDGSTVKVDPRGKVEVVLPKGAGPAAKKPEATPDRKAAEWALAAGGKVWVRPEKPDPAAVARPVLIHEVMLLHVGGDLESRLVVSDAQEVRAAADLPAGPFRLVGASLATFDPAKGVTDAGLRHLRDLPELAWLNLFGNPVTDAGMEHLAGLKSLRWLSLQRTQVTDAGLERLAGLAELRVLYLNDLPGVTDAGLKRLPALAKLAVLRCGGIGSGLTADGFAGLKGLPNLAVLECIAEPVSEATLKGLASFPALTALGLGGTRLGDADLPHLAKLTNLTALNVSANAITDTGLKPLAALSRLTELWLDDTRVTADGAKPLATALPGCRITYPGGAIEPTNPDRAAAEWVLSVGGKVTVRARPGEREVTAANDLPPGPLVVTAVDVSARPEVTDGDLRRLAGLRALRVLSTGDTKVTGAGLVHLKGLDALTHLWLYRTAVTDAGLEHLAGLTALVLADLNNTPLTGAGFKHLTGLTALESLSVGGSRLDDEGLQLVGKLPAVVKLDAAGTRVTDAGLAALEALPRFVSFNFTRTRVTDAGLARLKAAPKLCELWLTETSVTDAGVAHLRGLKSLGILVVDGTKVTDAGLEHLAGLGKLGHLKLSRTAVTEAGVGKLRKARPAASVEWEPAKK